MQVVFFYHLVYHDFLLGFTDIRIIKEPSAAAMAFGLGRKGIGDRNVLVFDLGGGTCDATIVIINDGFFRVKSTAGDNVSGLFSLEFKSLWCSAKRLICEP